MAQPQAYNREVDFTERDGDDTNHAGINAELDAAALSVNQIRDNLALLQKDDGSLQNAVVTAESLTPSAFDAVLGSVAQATQEAQSSAQSALTSAITAGNSATAASNSAASALASQNAAALNAVSASNSAIAAAASQVAAAASQAAAGVSAGAASTSETNALASANAAAGSAATATTKAGEALTSANNASASEISADASMDAALVAKTAAEAALDSFDDRYLGAKAVAPTLDNDGNALLTGTLYWDTVLPGMRAWTGAAWSTLPAATAAATANTPAGNIASTTVQAAINELDTEKVSLTGNETIAGIKTFSSAIAGSITGNAATATTATTATTAAACTGNAATASGVLFKADHTTVAFTKLTAGTAEVKAGTLVEVDGTTITFAAATAITMPALTAGTDYAIYACTDGTIRADASFSAPSGYTTANSRKIGGFHYAPGGNSTGVAGGDTTPAINAYSFWDLKFKPACPDPRGMALVAGGFWVDIYLTGVDAITNGSSKYNVTVADGSSPPKVPSLFGGNGTTTYGTYTWFEAMEMGAAFGKRCLSQQEFMAAMYGTTEATQSGGTDVPTTGVTGTGATSVWNVFTSKWGVVQSTGCMWVWGLDRGGAYNTAGWNANTEGRGSEYNAPNAVLLGGSWVNGAGCGSRCSVWDSVASLSNAGIGSRFSCDHLQLE